MNIWCISKYASPPSYSKVPARLFELTKEFIKQGHRATLLTSDSNHFSKYPQTKYTYNFETIDSIPLCWIKTKKYTKTASISRVLSWLDFERKLFKLDTNRLDKPDVVIVSSLSIFSILYGYFLKKKFKCFLVFEIRDIWPLTMTEEGGFSEWHPLVVLIGLVEKFGYKKADLIVGTMPKLDEHVKNILGYEKPFFCAPMGFSPENYAEESYCQEKNPFDKVFPKDKIIIGYAGSMGITNALESFITTIKSLKNNEKLHFMLVGSGNSRIRFEEELDECKNVTFLPRIEQNEVKYFLKKCDILYLSTQYSEVWKYGQSMNKVAEYMLASKPIIASYSGYPSMINEANCGKFVKTSNPKELEKAIMSIVTLSPEERERLGENGKKWIYENRQYSKIAKDYIEKIKQEMKHND